jgi:hypothetical protein
VDELELDDELLLELDDELLLLELDDEVPTSLPLHPVNASRAKDKPRAVVNLLV